MQIDLSQYNYFPIQNVQYNASMSLTATWSRTNTTGGSSFDIAEFNLGNGYNNEPAFGGYSEDGVIGIYDATCLWDGDYADGLITITLSFTVKANTYLVTWTLSNIQITGYCYLLLAQISDVIIE